MAFENDFSGYRILQLLLKPDSKSYCGLMVVLFSSYSFSCFQCSLFPYSKERRKCMQIPSDNLKASNKILYLGKNQCKNKVVITVGNPEKLVIDGHSDL